jgi:diaminopimelate epimerase
MPLLSFIKMQGLGNDFIVIDGVSVSREKLKEQERLLTPKFAREICDRRFGVGADQILWLRPAKSKKAVARMEILNCDGSIAEMCGNGIRAVAVYLNGLESEKNKKKSAKIFPIETLAGLLTVELKGAQVRVDMGPPKLGEKSSQKGGIQSEKLAVNGASIQFWEVSMGNPHAVIFVDGLAGYPVEREGAMIEVHPRFPKRTNVEYVEVISRKKMKVRVWERGAGITLACGTGACASAVAAIASGKTQKAVEVELPGGVLFIEWSGSANHSVFMTGPAEEVFRGEFTVKYNE